jgi:hypothetical protein
MSSTLLLRIKGLWTNLNEFSEIPDGALATATNIALDQDSIAECRRGFLALFNIPSSGFADRLNEFQNELIVHYASKLAWYDGTLHTFSGTYANPSSTVTMKFANQNQNFYFTTSNGVYKLDILSNTPVPSGVPAALDVELATNGSSGFLVNDSSVAYRVVWGFTDANNNLLLSAPSQITQINNGTGSAVNVTVTSSIPAGITVNNFYQVYRGDQIAYSGGNPVTADDNMQLVYEGNPNSTDLTNGYVSVIDITPDALRGAALYTNATQEGILQENTQPPFCTDITTFKNCVFFANTSTVQNQTITLLSVGGSVGLVATNTITIGANTFTAISGTPSAGSNNYQLVTGGSPAQNIDGTARNFVQTVNRSTTNTTIYAYYLSGVNDLPGQILFQNRNLSGSVFAITVNTRGTAWSPTLPTSGTTVSSTNTQNLNGLMYSKQQEPEAVPALNIFYPGSANKAILRILSLRDSLFILKQDGVFRLTGTSPADFVIDTLDNTVFLTVPDSASALNNQVYCLTTQGVVQVSDTGVSVISRPIENVLNQIIGTVGATNMSKYSFGASYESERRYILFMPQDSTDTSASIAYVYNYFTKAWTTWDRNEFCAYVLSTDNKLYMGNSLFSDVVQERKNYSYTDYTDESFAITISAFAGPLITLASAASVSLGDVIYQSTSVFGVVQDINFATNVVTVDTNLTSWTVGAAQLLKAIPCTLEWVPTTGQNPGMLKQYNEALLIFRASPFDTATIEYLSDISGGFDAVPIQGYSPLGWGLFPWGESLWGGVARAQTIRHYIPKEKQRCTLLTPQFFVQNGWSNFQLEGLSLQFRQVSSRTMR